MEPEEVVSEMEEIKQAADKETWLSYLTMTTIILAVAATLSSFKEGNNSVDSVLNQAQAANQWSYYQSKSIKGYLYEMQKDKLDMELKAARSGISPELIKEYEDKIEFYRKELERYAVEKKDIMKEAKTFEKERDLAQRRANAFGIGVVFLQMGILLSSISALMRKKFVWIIGTAVGLVGIVYFSDGFMLIIN